MSVYFSCYVVVLELSKTLAHRSVGIVCGGSNFGLLGVMAESAVNNGGKVTGIIPGFFTSERY